MPRYYRKKSMTRRRRFQKRRGGKMTAARVRKIVKRTVSNSERKNRIDIGKISDVVSGAWVYNTGVAESVCNIPVGDYGRVGRYLRITAVHIKMELYPEINANGKQVVFNIGLDEMQDGKDNGDISGKTFLGFTNYLDETRRTLWRRSIPIHGSKADGDVSGGVILVNKFIKLKNHVCQYLDTSSTVQPEKRNLVLWARVQAPGTPAGTLLTTNDVVRVYFSEV